MKKSVSYILPLILLFTGGFEMAEKRKENFIEKFKPYWERTRAYTLVVAESMPEEKYDFRPAEGMMTFGEQMAHIVGNISRLNSSYIKKEKNPFPGINAAKSSKPEIMESLSAVFDYVEDGLPGLGDSYLNEKVKFGGEEVPRRRILYLMKDHTTHHRAQAIVYLRLNDIKPPGYVGY